jgi:hypothetical protein
MMDMKRLGAMRAALYGPGAGRTTAALAEALDRLWSLQGDPAVLVFVGCGPTTMIPSWKEDARTVAEAMGMVVTGERRDALVIGPWNRELRFVTARQFLHGIEGRGRNWGGRREPSFVADPGVLELLWRLRRKA